MINPAVLHKMLPTIVPLASHWVTSVEKDLWNFSRPLTPDETADAIAMGISQPDKIRVAIVERLPEPSAELKHLAEQLRILTSRTESFICGRTILIKTHAPDQAKIILHELAHALQIERSGGVQAFLRKYFEQCLDYGNENCPMEIEVRTVADRVLASRAGNIPDVDIGSSGGIGHGEPANDGLHPMEQLVNFNI